MIDLAKTRKQADNLASIANDIKRLAGTYEEAKDLLNGDVSKETKKYLSEIEGYVSQLKSLSSKLKRCSEDIEYEAKKIYQKEKENKEKLEKEK